MANGNVFSNVDYAITQLKHDTLLEGYITEELFKRQFLENKHPSYTTGWWSATIHNKRYF